MQVFLNFANFYQQFIYNYFIIIESLIDLLKDNKNNKKFKFFI